MKNGNFRTIYDVVKQTGPELLKIRNFGFKTLDEINTIIESLNLTLGMDLSGFSVPAGSSSLMNIRPILAESWHPTEKPAYHRLAPEEIIAKFCAGRQLCRIFGGKGVRHKHAVMILEALIPFCAWSPKFAPAIPYLARKVTDMLKRIGVTGYPVLPLSIRERRRVVLSGNFDQIYQVYFEHRQDRFKYTPLTWRAFLGDSRLSTSDFIHVFVRAGSILKNMGIRDSLRTKIFRDYGGGGLGCHFTVIDMRSVIVDILECHISFLALGWLPQARITKKFLQLILQGNIPMGIIGYGTRQENDHVFLVATA